jgi:effector-binding domain-containing protein
MIKIGTFSRISQVSVKTLRYYDEIGLLKPAQIDRFTGYRFYAIEQLPQLNRILALKELGFSLEQIAQVMRQGLSAEELRGILRLKQAEITLRLQSDQDMLSRIETRIKQIEQENQMPTYDILIKKIEPFAIASTRGIIPSYPEQGGLWNTLESYLAANKTQPAGPCFTIYHADEPEIDAEVCEPLAAPIQADEPVKSYLLPGVEAAASTIHHGPFVTIGDAYAALIKWIEENGYQICGPCREIYLRPSNNGSQTDPSTLTEIQFPVRKA